MAGSNGVYPYFDAPVVGISEDARQAVEAEMEAAASANGIPAPRYSSLLMTGILAPETACCSRRERSDIAARLAKLRGLNHEGGVAPRTLPSRNWPIMPSAPHWAAR